MKTILKISGSVGVIFLLNVLINLIFVSKNNGEKYVKEYIKQSKEFKIKVNSEYFEGSFDRDSYFVGTFLFKGIYRGYAAKIIKDDYGGRYFKIIRFDPYGDKFSRPQTYKIKNQELIVKVDPLQLNDKKFGTKENPILVFWYKGANKALIMDLGTDEMGEDGYYKQVPTLISPTEKEYHYNVEQYLTYVMPKEEFKRRFKNK